MNPSLALEFEKAIRLLSERMPHSEETSRKPVLFHGVRVGIYLYEHNYSQDIVIAGLLHDILEDTDTTETELEASFGKEVTRLVLASTKNDNLHEDKLEELIRRCTQNGEDALIVKSADILDSCKWYSSQNNKQELNYCLKNIELIFSNKPEHFSDKIFTELKNWEMKCRQLV